MSSPGPHDLEARLRVLREEEQAIQERLATLKQNGNSLDEFVLDEPILNDDSSACNDSTESSGRARRLLQLVALALILPVLAFGGWRWWLYLDTYESTDDAQVDGHIAPISSRISGTIARVYVQDTDWVESGQLVAEIDPRDEQAIANSARA